MDIILPPLGLGTCYLGENPNKAEAEKEKSAILRGISLGMNLVDSAEMYGGGAAELLIGDMLRSRMFRRGGVKIVTKVYPFNSSPPSLNDSCDSSLKRLGTDYIDVYLLHWRDYSVNLPAVVHGMEALARQGKILRWGVSNFDVADMEELFAVPGGQNCAVDQVMYHLGSRGIEYDLLPWLRGHGVATMAYCPLAQGGRLRRTAADFRTDATLGAMAKKYNASIFQIMLAFVLRNKDICAIPKAANVAHVEENATVASNALASAISAEDWAAIDLAYPPPSHKMHLDID